MFHCIFTENSTDNIKLEYLEQLRQTLQSELPLPLGIIQIIYKYTASQLEIDNESEREINIIEEIDLITIDYIHIQVERKEWAEQTAISYIIRPDIVSFEWTRSSQCYY